MFRQRNDDSPPCDKKGAKWLFLIGLFSMTQLRFGAKIGISEIACCLVAPILFLKNLAAFSRDGVMPYFLLLIAWIFSALFSDFYNGAVFVQLIRGASVPITIFSACVCVYYFLRRDPRNLRWILLGMACSYVLSIFVFQSGSAGDLAAEGDLAGAVDAVVGYKLFWSNTVKTALAVPINCWYESVPVWYLYPALIAIAVANVMTGGRSAFAVSVLSIGLFIFGGKTAQKLRRIHRVFPIMIIGVLCCVFVLKSAYSFAARHGYLNEEETAKYEKQTKSGGSPLALLMAGRSEFFVGLIAALDKPFVGHGSQALDKNGYRAEFLAKYGTQEDIDQYMREVYANGTMLCPIPAHSHVICYWMWHGICALFFWLYILYLVVMTVWRRLPIIPEWFGYFAIFIPAFLWDYFFSPFGARVAESTFFCAMLILLRIERLSRRQPRWR